MAWKESRAARRARVARQLRDRHGKWIEMGGGIKWFGNGKNKSGKAVAFVGDKVRVQMKDGSHELVSSRQVEPIKAKARIPNNNSTLTAKRTSSQGNQIVRIKDNDDSQRLSSNGSDLQVGDRVYHIGGANSRKKYSENQNQGQRLEADGYDIKLKSDGKLSYDTVAERVEGSHLTTTDGSRIEWDDLVLADDPEISDAIEKAMPGFDEDNSEDSASAKAETSQEKSTDPAEAIRAQIAKEREEFNARPEAERQLRTAGFTEKDIKDFNEAADIDDLKKFGDLDNSRNARKEAISRESRTAPWATGEIERSEQDFTNGPLKEKAAELLGSPEAAKDYSDALNAGADHDAARDFAKASSSADVDKALSKSIKDTSDLETKDFLSDQERRDAERSHRLNNLAEKKKERLGSEDSAEAKTETPKRDDVDLTGLGLSKEESDYINEADNLEEALQRMDESDAAITNDVAKENGDKEFQRAYRNARNELMSKYSSDSDESASDAPEAPQTGKGTPTESVAKALDNLGADLKEIDDNGLEDDAFENALDEAIYDFKGDDGRDFFMSGSKNEEGDWEVDLFDDGDNHLGSFSPSDYKNSSEFAEAIKDRADKGVQDSDDNDTVETPTNESEPENGREEAGTEEGTEDSEGQDSGPSDVDSESDNGSEAPTEVVESPEANATQQTTSPLAQDNPAIEAIQRKIDSKARDFSDEEHVDAVAKYTFRGDGQINWGLRQDRLDKMDRTYTESDYDVAEATARIDDAMTKSSLPGQVLARGMVIDDKEFAVGDILSDKGFVSTSSDPSVAGNFMSAYDNSAMIKIDLDDNFHGLDVNSYLEKKGGAALMMAHEKEILLPRGTRLEITQIEDLTDESYKANFPDGEDLGFTANFGAKHKLFHARIVSDDKGLNGAHDDSNIGVMPEAYDPIQKAWFEEFGTYDAPEAFNELPSIKTDEHITQFTERVEITDIAEFAREYGQAREIQHMRDIMYADPKTAFVDEDGYTIRNRPGNTGFAVEDPNLGVTHYVDGVEKDADGFWKDRSPSSYYEEMAAIKRESNLDRPMDNSKYASESSADDQNTSDSVNEDIPTPAEAYADSDPEISDLERQESLFQQDPEKIAADIRDKWSDDPLGEREALSAQMREITERDYTGLSEAEIIEFEREYDRLEYEKHLLNEKYDLPNEFENAPGDQDINEGGEDDSQFTENAPGDIVTDEEQSSIPEGEESGREESESGDGTDGGDGGGDTGDGTESIDSGTDSGGVREETEDVGNGTGSELRGLNDAEASEIADWISGLSYNSPLEDRTIDLPSGHRVMAKRMKDTRTLRYRVYEQDGEQVDAFIGHSNLSPDTLAQRMQDASVAYARVKDAMNSEDRTLANVSNDDLAIMGPGTVMISGDKKFRKLTGFVWEYGNADDEDDRSMSPSLGRTPQTLFSHDRDAVQLYHDDESALTEFELANLSDDDLDAEIKRLKDEADKHAKRSGELGDKQHLQQRDLRPDEKVDLEYSTAKAAHLARRGRALAREKFSRMTADEILENFSLDHIGNFDNHAATENTENALPQAEWDKVRNTYVTKDATTLKNNESLRSDSPSRGAKAWGTRVKKMVDSQRLRDDATFFRGIAASPEVAAQFKPGAVFTDKGAMSVDRDSGSANSYLQARHNLRPDSIPVMMDLKVRKGQNIADVAYGEFVLAPDTRVFVEKVEDDGNTRRVTGIVNPTDDEINEWRNENSEDSSGDSEAEADASSDTDRSAESVEAETETSTDSSAPRRVEDADITEIERKAQELHDDIQNDDDPVSRMGEGIDLPDGSQLLYESINDEGDEGWLLLDPNGNTIGRYGLSNKAPGRKAAKRAQTVWDRENGGAPAAPRAEAQPSVPEMEGAPFKSGDRVTHGKHGKGTVSKIEGNGEYARISFDAYPSKLYGIKMSRLTPEGNDSNTTPSAPSTVDTPSSTPGPVDSPVSSSDSPFQVDDRVVHGKHGAGKVTRLEGNGEYARIEFDHTPGKHYGIKMSRLQSEQSHLEDPDTKIDSKNNDGTPAPDPAPSKTKISIDDTGEPFISGKNDAKLYVGAVVIHPKFGRGRVVKLENNGQYVRVIFDNDPLGKPRGIVGGRLEDAAIVENRDLRK